MPGGARNGRLQEGGNLASEFRLHREFHSRMDEVNFRESDLKGWPATRRNAEPQPGRVSRPEPRVSSRPRSLHRPVSLQPPGRSVVPTV